VADDLSPFEVLKIVSSSNRGGSYTIAADSFFKARYEEVDAVKL
jgi:hypothetical protein